MAHVWYVICLQTTEPSPVVVLAWMSVQINNKFTEGVSNHIMNNSLIVRMLKTLKIIPSDSINRHGGVPHAILILQFLLGTIRMLVAKLARQRVLRKMMCP